MKLGYLNLYTRKDHVRLTLRDQERQEEANSQN